MKSIVKKKTNPEFKRVQVLPLLSDFSARPTGPAHSAAAPAVVIIDSVREIVFTQKVELPGNLCSSEQRAQLSLRQS